MSGDVVARAKELLAYEDGYPVNTCGKHTGRASNRCLLAAGHDGAHDDDPPPLTFPDSLAAELVAEIEKLRRGGKELGRIIERQCLDVLEITGLHHMIDADGDGDWGVVWERLAEMAAAGAEVEKLRGGLSEMRAAMVGMRHTTMCSTFLDHAPESECDCARSGVLAWIDHIQNGADS
jgi:hypothetical protein